MSAMVVQTEEICLSDVYVPRPPLSAQAEHSRLMRERLHTLLKDYDSACRPLPSHPSRPKTAWLQRIADEAGIRRGTISYLDHPNRKLLDQYVSRLGLKPVGGDVGARFEHSARVTGLLQSYLAQLEANGRKLPKQNGEISFATVAREAGMNFSTLKIPGHKNRKLVEEAAARLGLESRRVVRAGPLALSELCDLLVARAKGKQT